MMTMYVQNSLTRSTEPTYRKFRFSEYKPSRSRGHYKPSPEDFVGSFYGVLNRWESETKYSSSTTEILEHPSYSALVENARLTLDLICDELKKKPSHLVFVLEDAFEIRPYSDQEEGNIPAMTNAWLSWAANTGAAR